MRNEVSTTSKWWADVLREFLSGASEGAVSHEQIAGADAFERALVQVLMQRYTGHWYESDPERGHAWRAISLDDFQLDPVLIKAARLAGLSSRTVHAALKQCHLGECVVFCDPFCVSVQQRKTRVVHTIHADVEGQRRHAVPAPTGLSHPRTNASQQLMVARQHFATNSRSTGASSSAPRGVSPPRSYLPFTPSTSVSPLVAGQPTMAAPPEPRGSNLLFTLNREPQPAAVQ